MNPFNQEVSETIETSSILHEWLGECSASIFARANKFCLQPFATSNNSQRQSPSLLLQFMVAELLLRGVAPTSFFTFLAIIGQIYSGNIHQGSLQGASTVHKRGYHDWPCHCNRSKNIYNRFAQNSPRFCFYFIYHTLSYILHAKNTSQ